MIEHIRSKMSKKVSKPLTIEQRVDLLMHEGVDHPEKWAAVHGYVEPSNYDKFDQDGHFNEVCFDTLREHHLEETEFLFDVIRELVNIGRAVRVRCGIFLLRR